MPITQQPKRQLLNGFRTHKENAPFHGALKIGLNNSPEESPGGCQCGYVFIVDTALPPGLHIHIQSCGDLKNPLDCFSKQFRH